MSMSDCEKCWDTPCVCGWDYNQKSDKWLADMRDMFQGLLDGSNKYSRHSRKVEAKTVSEEYLRRNIIHAKSVGVCGNLDAALKRLLVSKKPMRWLISNLKGSLGRARVVSGEMAKHRDEVEK